MSTTPSTPTPAEGGRYVRDPDGTLRRVGGTDNADGRVRRRQQDELAAPAADTDTPTDPNAEE